MERLDHDISGSTLSPRGRAPNVALSVATAALQQALAQLPFQAEIQAQLRVIDACMRAVEEERALLDTLLASAPIGFDLVDRELRFVRINAYLASNNGLSVTDHLGRTVREVLPQLADRVEPLLRQVLETGEPITDIEVTGETWAAPGIPRIWRESLYPVYDGAGQIFGVGTIVAEITEYRRISVALRESEERLRESEGRFRIALGGMPVTVWNQDRNLRYTWVYNPAPGYTSEQILGCTDMELLERPDEAAAFTSLKQQVLATGRSERCEIVLHQAGQPRFYDMSIEPLHDADGEIVGLVGAVIDLTARHLADAEQARLLQVAEEAVARTATLQSITAALASALTPPQVAEAVVSRAVTAFGARSGVLAMIDAAGTTLEAVYAVGYPGSEYTAWRWPLSMTAPLSDAVREGRPILVCDSAEAAQLYPELTEARARLPDVAWANLPLVTERGIEGGLSLGFSTPQRFGVDDRALLHAIAQQCAQALERARLYAAERQAREEAERAVRDRDNLIALISHDLKNPLTVIQGQAQLMERRLARGDTLEVARIERGLGAVREAALRMSAQIEELLDVALLRAGRNLHLDPQPTDRVIIVERAFTLAQASSEQHSMRLQATEDTLICVCDGPRVERVIINLLSNALKYSPLGGEISSACRKTSSPAA